MHNGKRKLEKGIRNLPKRLVLRNCDGSKALLPQLCLYSCFYSLTLNKINFDFKKQNILSTFFDMYHVICWELDFDMMKFERVYE